jgi:cytochrome c oxidase assembly protein subunit 15
MAIVQAALGIKALLTFVPVSIGAAHQGGAVILLSLTLFALHEAGRGRAAAHQPPARHAAAA